MHSLRNGARNDWEDGSAGAMDRDIDAVDGALSADESRQGAEENGDGELLWLDVSFGVVKAPLSFSRDIGWSSNDHVDCAKTVQMSVERYIARTYHD